MRLAPKRRVGRDHARTRGRRFGHVHPWLLLVLLLGAVVLGGCGVKGPPVPLKQPAPLPTVMDLAYQVTARSVTLTWSLPSPLAAKAARQASFIVRRSRSALDTPPCANCPMVFERVGMLPYVDPGGPPFSIRLALETGYRYAFTVHLKVGERVAPDSTPVRFDYTPEEVVVPVEEP